MSEKPVPEPRPPARESLEEKAVEAPAPPKAVSLLPSLIVAAVSFVVVLVVIIAVWELTKGTSLPPPEETPEEKVPPAQGGFDVVTLLENYVFVTTLPPTGDRSITYQYTIVVKVVKSRRAMYDDMIAPDKKNMLPAIKENVRKIIASEDYLKLRAEQLDDVKRHIKHYLNGLMNAEVIDDVIFDKWNVIS